MKIYGKPALGRTRTWFSRVLAFVLLVGIVYAVVFGSAHTHLSISSKAGTNLSASSSRQVSAASTLPPQPGSNGDGCLICLFHQQLFNSIVHDPAFIDRPSPQVVLVSALTTFYHSTSTRSRPSTRLSGRAPPIA